MTAQQVIQIRDYAPTRSWRPPTGQPAHILVLPQVRIERLVLDRYDAAKKQQADGDSR